MPRLNTEEARAQRNARKRAARAAKRPARPVQQRPAQQASPHVPAALRRLVTHLDENGPTNSSVLKHVTCGSEPSKYTRIRELAKEMGLIAFAPWLPSTYGQARMHTITDAGREWLKQPGHRWPNKAQKP